jgi:N-acyl-D-amino-acid deacylase
MTAYDLVIRNGTIYDGDGGGPVHGDVAIGGDMIVANLPPGRARGKIELDATGLAVAPGFINMLSWANETLLVDGRSQSEIRQGVTLEVMGEGWSMGPLNEAMRKDAHDQQGDLKYEISWTTLAEYLDLLAARGVSTNVASFLGAATVRINVLGHADRPPNASELDDMRAIVQRAMQEGALGVSSALIYPPGFFASTNELIELAKVVSAHGGMYISHIRSEGSRLLEGLDELITIAREAKIRAEIYHLKAAGNSYWPKWDEAIAKIEAARGEGLAITADMYTYTAAGTWIDATMPPWVQEGGFREMVRRLKDPATRERIKQEMRQPAENWENWFLGPGSPENILLVGFKSEGLKKHTGQSLAAISAARGTSPEDTIFDLIVEDDSRPEAIYFLMKEENIKKQIALPWVSFGSDALSLAPEGIFLGFNTHPRAYGTFARLLGKYVRDERVIPLAEAIRRLTSLPAANLRLDRRGRLAPGYHADVVVFDPARIQDHATYDRPHQYATGMRHVVVNGTPVLRDGEHTGATPGQVVRGPGARQQRR